MRSAPDAVVARYLSLTSALLLPPSIATLRSATQSASLVQQRVRVSATKAAKSSRAVAPVRASAEPSRRSAVLGGVAAAAASAFDLFCH